MGRRRGKRLGLTLEQIRVRAAIGTTQPLPVPEPRSAKAPKLTRREKWRRNRQEAREAEWLSSSREELAEPRDEELEAMHRHLDSILPNPVGARALKVHIKPHREQRAGLDPHHHRKRRASYDERDSVVRSMGFRSYRDYLASPIWETIRSRILARDATCVLCDRPSKQAHHVRYTKRVLEGRDDKSLVGLCGGCHHRIEFRERDHEKLSPSQVRAKLNMLLTLKRKTG